MSTCAACGLQMSNDSELCTHHTIIEDNWHIGNRVWCDFFHRGIPLVRLPLSDREEVDYGIG